MATTFTDTDVKELVRERYGNFAKNAVGIGG